MRRSELMLRLDHPATPLYGDTLELAQVAASDMLAQMAFDMPSDMAIPTYVVYRDTSAGEAFDPTAPPVFFPPKDSDALVDALRAQYPHVKSHSERMRDAVIEFLIEERQAVQSEQVPVPAAGLIDPRVLGDVPAASPSRKSWPSMSSGSTCLFSSPASLNPAAPGFSMSPPIQEHPLGRFSTPTSTAAAAPASHGTAVVGSTTLEQMTGVFSVSAAAQPRQRVRRKMTEAEKADYRKRRIVKACGKCQKRKRKCTHNQPEMENLAAKQKATNPNKQRAQLRPQAAQQSFWETELDHMEFESNFGFDPAMFGTDMQLFDDDLTLVQDFHGFGQQGRARQFGTIPTVSWEGRDPRRHTQDFDNLFGLDGSTAAVHVPGPDGDGSYVFDASGAPHITHTPPSRPQWSKIVLQLMSTHKAIKAFGKLARSRSARVALQSVPIGKTASLLSYGISQDVSARQDKSIPRRSSVHDTGLLGKSATENVLHPTRASALAGAPLSWAGRGGSQDGLRLEVEGLRDTAHDRLQHGPVRAAATSSTSRSSKEPASAFAPVSGPGSLFEKESDPAHNQGRPDWGTLGEGIDRVPSPSAEMFMLRRSIPKALHSIVDRNNSRPLADLRVMRSRYGTKANPAHMDGTGAFATANPVVHAHIAYPVPSGPDRIVRALESNPSKDSKSTASTAILAPASEVAVNTKVPSSGSGSGSGSSSFPSDAQDRLSYHVTYRHHFGRSSARMSASSGSINPATNTIMAVLAGTLLLASLLLQQTQLGNLTLLLLALAMPTHSTQKSIGRRWRVRVESLVQCTTKNSSWLRSLLLRSPWRSKSEYVCAGIVEDRGGRGCLMRC
ncbi:hypothetical protein EJ03DRAFT_117687 [Teratosphaeria nubilosa]|uniref:Uncharacterized protein n=1 Tax=Teratosphaeria nubilosa TaxID=161662 RepID=A0A6G1L6P4_9PEZI|nr:hypothetical protein EJ03DRAFT_117687 [Teratosphaeria nubilosa]